MTSIIFAGEEGSGTDNNSNESPWLPWAGGWPHHDRVHPPTMCPPARHSK